MNFFRFMYHDISLLYNHIKDKKLRSIKFDQNKKKISYININF